jgi:hypothetical protein
MGWSGARKARGGGLRGSAGRWLRPAGGCGTLPRGLMFPIGMPQSFSGQLISSRRSPQHVHVRSRFTLCTPHAACTTRRMELYGAMSKSERGPAEPSMDHEGRTTAPPPDHAVVHRRPELNRHALPSRFHLVITNPPFQDTLRRKKTPHKLWIDFTESVFDRLIADGGLLCQVSPSSWCSPSNRILELMKRNQVLLIRHDTGEHFPTIGSTFSDYIIRKRPSDGRTTPVIVEGVRTEVSIDKGVSYVPNDLSGTAVSIHRKVVFGSTHPRARVEWDYVSCHNILRHRGGTLSTTQTDVHRYPVFHTNRQVWWSSLRQPWADAGKVMWTRSGYTKPFYDDGVHGGTDMVYFIRVPSVDAGLSLEHNMNLPLMKYIYATARWSGFGNERVFAALPQLPVDRKLSNVELMDLFQLTDEERAYVGRYLA